MNEALQLVADLRAQITDFPLQTFGGLFREGGDADIGDIVAFHARAHRADPNIVRRISVTSDRIVLALRTIFSLILV